MMPFVCPCRARTRRLAVSCLSLASILWLTAGAASAQPVVTVGDGEDAPGATVELPVSLDLPSGTVALQVDLVYDPDVLSTSNLDPGPTLADHVLDWATPAPGRLRVTLTTVTRSSLGAGELFTVPFVIAGDAPPGDQPVELEAALLADATGLGIALAELVPGAVTILGGESPIEIPTLGFVAKGALILLLVILGLVIARSGSPGGPSGLVLLIVAVLAALLIASPVALRAQTLAPGDANGDGNVDAADIPVIVDQILERSSATGDPDCNEDTQVDVRDTICATLPASVNSPPTLSAIADRAVREREVVALTAVAADPDLPGDTLTWTLPQKPVGATIDHERGTLLWVPTGDQVGTHPITVQVTDAAGASDQGSFEVTVRDLGGPPVIAEIADQTTVEGNALIVDADATDPDLPGDTLTFTLTLAPTGMTIDPGSGGISWTPSSAQVGVHDVTVQVTDAEGLLDFTSFVVAVRAVNVAPTARDDAYEARLGVPLAVAGPGVLGNDTDPNDDPLTAVLGDDAAQGALTLATDGSFDYLLEPPDRSTPVALQPVCESVELAAASSTIAVGDVDGDGISELVATVAGGGLSFVDDVLILNALDCSVELNTAGGDLEAAGGMSSSSHPGLFDLDGDGDLEIIGTRYRFPAVAGGGFDNRHLVAIHHDGTLVWPGDGASESSPLLDATPNSTSANHYGEAGPTFADLDADGTVEIVMAFKDGTGSGIHSGLAVYDATDGSLLWEFLSTSPQGGGETSPPYVVDLDLDGTMEVIVHNSVVDHLGELELELPSTPPSGTTTSGHLVLGFANVDDDPFPELFGRDLRARYLFEHDGTLTQKLDDRDEWNGSRTQIAVADFDGDGEAEYSFLTCPVAFSFNCGSLFLVIHDSDGSLLWSHEGQPDYLHTTGGAAADDWNPTAFDANRDGAMDLVMANPWKDTLSIFDGRDGSLLAEIEDAVAGGAGGPRFVAVADLDQDGDAEIVERVQSGIFLRFAVWTGADANPLPAAPTYRNQWMFHEAYSNPDASIPTNPIPHWLQPGRNGWNLLTPEPDPLIGTTDTFTYTASDGALGSSEATVTLEVLPAGNPPRFLTEPDTLTTRGFLYDYAPIVVDPDLGDTVTFRLTAGPGGMTIDPATGRVRWTPEVNGGFEVSILALDTIGFATDQSYTLTVGDPVVVPDVVGQPEATAESTLTAANLVIGRKRASTHPTIPAGAVVSQSPIAGSVAEFGGDVDLRISLGPAPEDVDNDGDGQTETGGDCNDGNDTIFPGAVDPPADGVDQDCDGFDGSEPVQEIVVEPETLTLLEGERRQLTAYAVFADGTAQLATGLVTWASLDPATATVSATGRVTAESIAGPATITATRGAVVGTAGVDVTAANGADDDAPSVEITSPADGESVFGPIDVIGTADDPDLVRYELAISPADEESFTVIGGGTASVVGGVLGQLDPTLMLNDLYTLRLIVLDAGGNETVDEVTVLIDGQQKVGNFTITFTDLEIPVAGIPITVTRTYDSRDKRKGDFGIGWRLGLQTIELSCTNPLGEGWFVAKSGLAFVLLETREHRCTIAIPGQRSETFELAPRTTISPIVPFSLFSGAFKPRAGTLGTLEAEGGVNLAIVDPQPGEVTLRNDGDLSLFAPDRFVYTAQGGTEYTFSTSGGLERVRTLSGATLTFDPNGITHSAGPSVAFERDAQGRIVAITDPAGNLQRYAYSAASDLSIHTDALGNSTRFFYDRNHGLLRIDDPLGQPAVRNDYDDEGRLISTTDAAGNVHTYDHDPSTNTTTHTDPLGNQQTISYDTRGNVLSRERILTIEGTATVVREEFTFDANGNTTSSLDPDGTFSEFSYDSEQNPIETRIDPGGLDIVSTITFDALGNPLSLTDPLGNATTVAYTAEGEIASLIDKAGGATTYGYDSQGRVNTWEDGNGTVTLLEHDAAGNITRTRTVDPVVGLSSEETRSYDALGRLVSRTRTRVVDGIETATTERTSYDAAGNVTSRTDELGNATTFAYDAAGQLVEATDPLGATTRFEYDSRGLTTRIVRADGTAEEREYDALGRLIANIDAAGRRTEHDYDEFGRRVETRHPGGAIERQVWSPAGRLIATIDARGNRTSFEYNALGQQTLQRDPSGATTRFEYDDLANLTALVAPDGARTEFTYGPRSELIEIRAPDGSTRTFGYDNRGNSTSETDELGRTTNREYDGAGRLIRVIDPLGGETTYSYDTSGLILSRTDASGATTRFEYDSGGRVTRSIRPDGTSVRQLYDLNGRLSSVVNARGQRVAYRYDQLGQRIEKSIGGSVEATFTYSPTGQVLTATDRLGTISRTFDPRDRLVRRVDAEGAEVAYEYDASGNLTALTTDVGGVARRVTYSYDATNRLSEIDEGGAKTLYDYDPVGRLILIERPNGVVTSLVNDANGRVREISHRNATTELERFVYTRDATGRVTAADGLSGASSQFGYDELGRLVSETHALSSSVLVDLRHTYDLAGNRIEVEDLVSGTSTPFSYDVAHRIVTAGSTTFTHDTDGNLTSRTTPSGSTTYQWSAENRLLQISDGGPPSVYTYDAFGRRVVEEDAGGARHYLVDDRNPTGLAQPVEVRSSSSSPPIESYTYGLDRVARASSGMRSYYQLGVEGSVQLLTDDAGASQGRYRYTGFGSILADTDTSGNRFRFKGELSTDGSDLYHMRARDYDPALGRFLSADPFPPTPEDPRTLARYAFGFNDPIGNSDPTGLFATSLTELSFVQGFFNTLNRFQTFLQGFKACNSAKTALQVVDWTIILGQLSAGLLAPAGDLTGNTIPLLTTDEPRFGWEKRIKQRYLGEDDNIKFLYENKGGSGSFEAEASIDGVTGSFKVPPLEFNIKGGGGNTIDKDLPLIELTACGGIKVGQINLNVEFANKNQLFDNSSPLGVHVGVEAEISAVLKSQSTGLETKFPFATVSASTKKGARFKVTLFGFDVK